MVTHVNKPAINALNFIKYFRAIDPEMPGQFIEVFLQIGADPGITTKKLIAETYLSQSSMSRATRALSARQLNGDPGHQLIVGTPDPHDSRILQWTLTPTGHALYKAVLGTTGDDPGPPPDSFARPKAKEKAKTGGNARLGQAAMA